MPDIKTEFKLDTADIDTFTKSGIKKAMSIGLNRAGSPIKASVISKAPVRFGYLQKAIRQKSKIYPTGNMVLVIGATRSFERKKSKRKYGKNKGQPIMHKPANYGRLVEKGTKFAKAKPYLAPALKENEARFREAIFQEIANEIKKLKPKSK